MSHSNTPSDAYARLLARREEDARQLREATMTGYRHRLVAAGDFDPDKLSEQGRRILRWLTEWDDWTTGGLVEILNATCTAAQIAVHREAVERNLTALRESEADGETALARYDEARR